MKRLIYGLFMVTLIFALSACGSSKRGLEDQNQDVEAVETTALEEGYSEGKGSNIVQVELINTKGEQTGTATLKQEPNGVNISIEAWNLPKGPHGFHIHEKGVCEPPKFESAGGHFNPTHSKHGFDNPKGPHAGDLPNLEVGADGKVQESFLNEMVTLEKGKPNSLLHKGGTSLVIHEKADDNVSQPAGNSGARIACGVISE